MLNFRSLKNYTADYYKETLKQVDFPNYENFGDVNEFKFLSEINELLRKSLPIKSKRVKWFNGEVLEKLNLER